MSNLLQRLNADNATKEALIDFIHEHINDVALSRMYKGEDVSCVKDAKNLIDSAFDALKDLYAISAKPKENTNEAR